MTGTANSLNWLGKLSIVKLPCTEGTAHLRHYYELLIQEYIWSLTLRKQSPQLLGLNGSIHFSFFQFSHGQSPFQRYHFHY